MPALVMKLQFNCMWFLKSYKLCIFNVKNYFLIIIVLDIAGLLETDLKFDNTLEYTKCIIYLYIFPLLYITKVF